MLLPVLTYLFHAIDRRLDGRPTLIVLDEAWVMLANGAFGAKIEEWLRTLRKKNAAVVLATQSLTEVANSPVRDVILESCPTKILLPNPEALNPATGELYRKLGLSNRQIEIVAERRSQAALLLSITHGTTPLRPLCRTRRDGIYRSGIEGRNPDCQADAARARSALAGTLAPQSRPRRLVRLLAEARRQQSEHRTTPPAANFIGGKHMQRRYIYLAAVVLCLTLPVTSPRTVRRLADCLRPEYVRAPAPAASAGNRYRHEPRSATTVRDQEHDRRRRRGLAVQPESAYEPRRSDQSAGRTLVYLSGPDSAVPAALSGLQRCLDRGSPESANRPSIPRWTRSMVRSLPRRRRPRTSKLNRPPSKTLS